MYVNVSFTDKCAHIANDSTLKSELSREGAHAVATFVKIYYQRTKRKDLNVGTDSMAVEIVGHVYPDKVAHIIKNSPLVPGAVKTYCNKLLSHTDVIDSGEASVDSNRETWDLIASLLSGPILALV